jgi:hypothetical protein
MKLSLRIIGAFLLFLALNRTLFPAFGQGTAFTYQGLVTDNGTNFNGTGQFQFALVTSTNGRQATATANMSGVSPNEFVGSITLSIGGSGYTSAPIVTISGGGSSSEATAQANISGGVVTSITLLTPGSGYTSTPTVTVAPPAPVYTTRWSNDGTSVNGSEPSGAVNVVVSQGLFTTVLGNTALANMTAIPEGVLSGATNLQLMIWFNDGASGFAMLSPVQSLTATPYADQSINATTASNLLGTLPVAQLSGIVPLPQLPAAVVTNNEVSSVTLNNLNVSGTLNLTAPFPAITAGGVALLGTDVNANSWAGLSADSHDTISTYANTAVGYEALFSNSSGSYNNAVGCEALLDNVIGYYNTADGFEALQENVSGNYNAAIGANALGNNTNGAGNVADGYQALYSNTSGGNNIAIGYGALSDLTTDSDVVAVGYQALQTYTAPGGLGAPTGSGFGEDTAVGFQSLQGNTVGVGNTALGFRSLQSETNAYSDTAVGDGALQYNTSGIGNTAAGAFALWENNVGSQNTAEGWQALERNTSSLNTGVGYRALGLNTTGSNNIALGQMAGYNITGSSNIDIGNQGISAEANVIRIGSLQTAAYIAGVINGNGAGLTNLNAAQLTVGGSTIFYYSNSPQNLFIGPSAGNPAGDSGVENNGIGTLALKSNTSGDYNTASGWASLVNNTSGSGNTANGAAAMYANTNGQDNTAVGVQALSANISGSYNVAVGMNALEAGTVSSENTAIGEAALNINSGSNNIALGYQAGSFFNSHESGNIDIGSTGQPGENNVTRIGTAQAATYIAGTVFDLNGVVVGTNGTPVTLVQSGQDMMQPSSLQETNFTVTFPYPFSFPPKIVFSIANDPGFQGVSDVFAASVSSNSVAAFTINVYRLNGASWSQSLRINWQAWE